MHSHVQRGSEKGTTKQMYRASIGQDEKNASQGTLGKYDVEGVNHGDRGDAVQSTVNQNAVSRGATLIHSRPPRRYIISFITLLLLTATFYKQFFRSRSDMIPVPETPEAMHEASATEGIYGINDTPDFANLIKVQDLDTHYVPDTGKGRRAGRLVIVGDVHGMKDELVKLLKKVSFDRKKDHLILVGDLITKGYDSLGVVDLAMELQASAVRGNHEDRVLLAYDELKSKQVKLPGPFEDPEKVDEDMEELSYSFGNYEDRELARSLNPAQLAWLRKLPVILRVGKLEGMGEVVVVHAGLVAGVALEAQDPFQAMNMRTIDMHSHVPSEDRDGTSWTKLWNHHQKQLPKNQRSTVIYGHDSKRGLRLDDYTKGIDTGCRKGHKLTALIIEGGASDVHQHIVQYKCEKAKKHKSEELGLELEFEEAA